MMKYQVGDWVRVVYDNLNHLILRITANGIINKYQIVSVFDGSYLILLMNDLVCGMFTIQDSMLHIYNIDKKYLEKNAIWITEMEILNLVTMTTSNQKENVIQNNVKCINCKEFNFWASPNPQLGDDLYLCYSCNTYTNRVIYDLI